MAIKGERAFSLNADITKLHTNLVPPYPRIHFMLMLLALLPHVPRRSRAAEEGLKHALQPRSLEPRLCEVCVCFGLVRYSGDLAEEAALVTNWLISKGIILI